MPGGNQFDIRDSDVYAPLMLSQPKQVVERSEEYKAWIRSLPCIRCQRQPSEAHHQPAEGHSSTGKKCSDYRCVPLCAEHHEQYHSSGRHTFWGGADVETIVARLNISYFFGARVAHI